MESFKDSVFVGALGQHFGLRQMNISVSRARTVRGIHFADVPPGQAKYLQCFSGSILDVVVDVRVGSPTFGSWDAVELNDRTRTALYVAEGIGHGFCAISDVATIGYLCSEPYAPDREHGINPMDVELGLPWPSGELVLSPKDQQAPTLAEALEQGILPRYEECRDLAASLRGTP